MLLRISPALTAPMAKMIFKSYGSTYTYTIKLLRIQLREWSPCVETVDTITGIEAV